MNVPSLQDLRETQLKVAVLMGGISAERPISLKSGQAVTEALQAQGINAYAIDFDRQGLSELLQDTPDVVFNILHGPGGENGELQGILNYLQIPYTGTGLKGSAITMDKLLTKKIIQANGIATPDFFELDSEQACLSVVDQAGLPVMVKPVIEGSSIGISKVTDAQQMIPAWQLASQYGLAFAEQFITGREITAAYLAGEVLPLIELATNNVFYDYEAKYESNETRYLCPCELDTGLREQINEMVLQTVDACHVSGWCRVDLMIDDNSTPYVIEVNTTPGMTDHSLVPMAAREQGMDFQQLVLRILQTAFENKW